MDAICPGRENHTILGFEPMAFPLPWIRRQTKACTLAVKPAKVHWETVHIQSAERVEQFCTLVFIASAGCNCDSIRSGVPDAVFNGLQ